LQATEVSKLQLIIALYVDYIWPDIMRFIATRSFYDEKDWHNIFCLW